MKPNKAIYTRRSPAIKNGQWVEKIDKFEVIVMAIVDNYAMVRRKGCMPFVALTKDLQQ